PPRLLPEPCRGAASGSARLRPGTEAASPPRKGRDSTVREAKRPGHKRNRGEGTFDRRTDGSWRARLMVGYKPDGTPDRRMVFGKTKAECQRKLDELRRRAAGGLIGDAARERDTVAAYLRSWLAGTESGIRGSTHKRYGEIVRLHLVPELGRHRLAAL